MCLERTRPSDSPIFALNNSGKALLIIFPVLSLRPTRSACHLYSSQHRRDAILEKQRLFVARECNVDIQAEDMIISAMKTSMPLVKDLGIEFHPLSEHSIGCHLT